MTLPVPLPDGGKTGNRRLVRAVFKIGEHVTAGAVGLRGVEPAGHLVLRVGRTAVHDLQVLVLPVAFVAHAVTDGEGGRLPDAGPVGEQAECEQGRDRHRHEGHRHQEQHRLRPAQQRLARVERGPEAACGGGQFAEAAPGTEVHQQGERGDGHGQRAPPALPQRLRGHLAVGGQPAGAAEHPLAAEEPHHVEDALVPAHGGLHGGLSTAELTTARGSGVRLRVRRRRRLWVRVRVLLRVRVRSLCRVPRLLRGVRLRGVRLRGVRLRGVRLRGVRLRGVRLWGIRAGGLLRIRLRGRRSVRVRALRWWRGGHRNPPESRACLSSDTVVSRTGPNQKPYPRPLGGRGQGQEQRGRGKGQRTGGKGQGARGRRQEARGRGKKQGAPAYQPSTPPSTAPRRTPLYSPP
ncbi:pentapeptide repeat-containing protein [Streptomyces sp. NPDC047049]|uniref:pentapeptide repeat-containing protein n=1 Tax=Streptomyces sp. NPDC047049 TaxID=3156688 RepID=UPI0033CA3FC0